MAKYFETPNSFTKIRMGAWTILPTNEMILRNEPLRPLMIESFAPNLIESIAWARSWLLENIITSVIGLIFLIAFKTFNPTFLFFKK